MKNNWREQYLFVFGQKVPLPFLLAVILAIIILSSLSYLINLGKWQQLKSDQYGYIIEYPSTWHVRTYGENGHRGSIFMRADFGDINPIMPSYAYLYEQPIESDTSLSMLAKWGEIIIDRQDGYNLSELETVTIGVDNYPALRRTYFVYGGGKIFTEVYYLINDDHGFALQFSAHEKKLESSQTIFKRMLDSFEFFE